MKKYLMLFLFINVLTFAQTENQPDSWELVFDQEGYKLYTAFPDTLLSSGEEETLVKWKLSTVQFADYDRCKNIITNIEGHKTLFVNCEEVKILDKKDNELVVYYYFDNPWPAPNIDNVRTTYINESENLLIFKQVCTPEKFEETDTRRMKVGEFEYKFSRVGTDSTKIEINQKFVPEGIPIFLVKSYFPDGPIDFVKKLIKLSSEETEEEN